MCTNLGSACIQLVPPACAAAMCVSLSGVSSGILRCQ